MGETALLPLRRRAEDFFALKNPTASVGFEPANLGTKGQYATSRPPKPHTAAYLFIIFDTRYILASAASNGRVICV